MKRLLVAIIRLFRTGADFIRYEHQYRTLSKLKDSRFIFRHKDKWRCLGDQYASTSFDKHYTYHTAWAARKLAIIRPDRHVDISSLTYFSTLVSAFIPVDFYDYRPAKISLDNFSSSHCDIFSLPFEQDSLASLSCMHVVEHIGLGRYGDPLDPLGDLKAIAELSRVVKFGGHLLFVVPVGGIAKIQFNAHRIYTYAQVISYFPSFQLIEFALIPDQSDEGLILNASESQSDRQVYGCGCFLLKKVER